MRKKRKIIAICFLCISMISVTLTCVTTAYATTTHAYEDIYANGWSNDYRNQAKEVWEGTNWSLMNFTNFTVDVNGNVAKGNYGSFYLKKANYNSMDLNSDEGDKYTYQYILRRALDYYAWNYYSYTPKFAEGSRSESGYLYSYEQILMTMAYILHKKGSFLWFGDSTDICYIGKYFTPHEDSPQALLGVGSVFRSFLHLILYYMQAEEALYDTCVYMSNKTLWNNYSIWKNDGYLMLVVQGAMFNATMAEAGEGNGSTWHDASYYYYLNNRSGYTLDGAKQYKEDLDAPGFAKFALSVGAKYSAFSSSQKLSNETIYGFYN